MKTELKYILPNDHQKIVDGLYALINRITKAFIQNNKSVDSNEYRKLVTPHFIRISEIQIEFQIQMIIIGDNQKELVKNGF